VSGDSLLYHAEFGITEIAQYLLKRIVMPTVAEPAVVKA